MFATFPSVTYLINTMKPAFGKKQQDKFWETSQAGATQAAAAAAPAAAAAAGPLPKIDVSIESLESLTQTVSKDVTLEDLVKVANLMLGPISATDFMDVYNLISAPKALALSGGGCVSVMTQ